MRYLVLPAAFALALLFAPMVRAATYTQDATYMDSGQTSSNRGRGIAVNTADTRLYATVRSSTVGKIVILDTADGTLKASITPASPTTINDIALSPDGTQVFFVKATATDWELDAAPAADGTHTSAEVTTLIATLGGTPGGIATARSASTVYVAVVTTTALQIYTSPSGGAFTKQSDISLPNTTRTRDVAALDTGSGIRFYVLTPGAVPQSAMLVYDAAGTPVGTTWSAIPAGFSGYTIDSVTSAGPVDGTPSLFLTADGADSFGNAVLTSFRYSYNGVYQDDGFGYGLSSTSPLKDLQPMDTSPTLAPGAVSNNHMYVGAALPDTLGTPINQTVRVLITPTTLVPGTITGLVKEYADSAWRASAGAKVVVAGVDSPIAVADATGAYSLAPVKPGTVTIGASNFGFAAAKSTLSLASGETKAASPLELPGTVPIFTLASAFAPPIIDGIVFADEYRQPGMPFYTIGGAPPSSSIETTAYAMYDSQFLYVAVVGLEPSLELNNAAYANQNMLTFDDNVQLYLDPPHRHGLKGTATNLFQFAINIPGLFAGQPVSTPDLFQRRINEDGTGAEAIPSSAWWATVGYFAGGWVVEGRISLTALAPFPAPDSNSVWGVLVARHRPSGHLDSLLLDYSTSDAQVGRLTQANTWTDVKFGAVPPSVPGDVNRNGVLDAADIAYVLRMAAGLSFGTPAPGDPSGEPDQNLTIRNAILSKGDVWPGGGADGRITVEDALRMARALAGLDTLNG